MNLTESFADLSTLTRTQASAYFTRAADLTESLFERQLAAFGTSREQLAQNARRTLGVLSEAGRDARELAVRTYTQLVAIPVRSRASDTAPRTARAPRAPRAARSRKTTARTAPRTTKRAKSKARRAA